MMHEFRDESAGFDDIEEFSTEIKATPVTEHANALIGVIKESEKYFPPKLSHLIALRDPALSLANFTEKDIGLIEASLAKIELYDLGEVPRWRDDEIKEISTAYELLRVELLQHLSRARKGHFLDKLTQISKIISYQANTAAPRRTGGILGLFGRR